MREAFRHTAIEREGSEEVSALKEIGALRPGQEITVCCRVLEDLYSPMHHNGATFTPADRVLENIVGSSCEYGYCNNLHDRTVTFFRLSEPLRDGRLSYVSPDRREYYNRNGRYWERS